MVCTGPRLDAQWVWVWHALGVVCTGSGGGVHWVKMCVLGQGVVCASCGVHWATLTASAHPRAHSEFILRRHS